MAPRAGPAMDPPIRRLPITMAVTTAPIPIPIAAGIATPVHMSASASVRVGGYYGGGLADSVGYGSFGGFRR